MKKAEKILFAVTIAASALISLYYLIYLILCLAGFDAVGMVLFALLVIALVSLPVIFRRQLKKLLERAFRPLHIIFTSLLCVYLVSLAAFWCYIGFDAAKSSEGYVAASAVNGDTGAGTVIMVFGCHTNGYTPGSTLKLRLDEAYRLLDALPDSICIVSGGQGSNETVSEADSMKRYLCGLGVDPERIYTEDASHSTSENIRFTKEALAEYGIEPERIIGVSTAFHLPRIEMLSRRHGLPMSVCAAPSPNFANYYVSMVREYLSYIKMVFFDELVIDVY